MKKYFFLLLSVICLKLHAQTEITKAISTGVELAIPSNGAYSIGVGASVKGELPIASPVSLTLTAGFTSMFYKSSLFYSSESNSAAIFIPLKAGLKYYFNKAVYAEGEAGAALETNYDKRQSFAFSFGPGFIAPIGDKTGVDISFRYESWANQLRQTALRFAYRF